MNIKQKRAWAEAEALKHGNRVDRQEYGSIEVSRTSKVSIPADGENVGQQFSLKAPVEEKNLLALHNLTEKNLLGRQHTPNFNPRPPRGGRLSNTANCLTASIFQSTPPRGGDRCALAAGHCLAISIHAPARGATTASGAARARCGNFNPRPREGGDPAHIHRADLPVISIHAPREGGDVVFCPVLRVVIISIHAPREGGDKRR